MKKSRTKIIYTVKYFHAAFHLGRFCSKNERIRTGAALSSPGYEAQLKVIYSPNGICRWQTTEAWMTPQCGTTQALVVDIHSYARLCRPIWIWSLRKSIFILLAICLYNLSDARMKTRKFFPCNFRWSYPTFSFTNAFQRYEWLWLWEKVCSVEFTHIQIPFKDSCWMGGMVEAPVWWN